jgi:protein-S-isoprenylcysteine O-methyltransferase Ste14
MKESSVLSKEFEAHGNWLFRWRSYLPLLLVPFAILPMALRHTEFGGSRETDFIAELVCLGISLAGLVVRMLSVGYSAAGTSGRNTREQVANYLNTRGMYSIFRHPLYVGNILMAAGVFLFSKNWGFAVAGILAYWIFYERIAAAEEQYLQEKFGDQYRSWAERTPYMFPRFSLWSTEGLHFSLRKAIRGEFYGFFALASSFLVLDIVEHWFTSKTFSPHVFWLWFFGVGGLIFIVARYLRKHTKLLEPRVGVMTG